MADVEMQFEEFFSDVEPRLRRALVARYGASTGRAVTVDALSYAWEHWDRLSKMENPVGYLFRVAQSASRRYAATLPLTAIAEPLHHDDAVTPELLPALADLPEQQRLAVTMVHGLGCTQREAAELLDVAPSTVQTHVERGLASLRNTLEATDA